jgi:hypothetical protein
MPCFTTDVQHGRTKFTIRSFDESFGTWVHLQVHSPGSGIGHMEVGFNVPLANAAAIGAALIAAAKAAGWVRPLASLIEKVETVA